MIGYKIFSRGYLTRT